MLVNYGAVLVAALVGMAVGWLWYSSYLFGPQWRRLRGVGTGERGFQLNFLIVEFICSLVTAYILALFGVLLPATAYAVIVFALIVWLGFYVTQYLSEVLWEEKPFGVFLINIGHRLLSLVLMVSIVELWR